MVRAAAKNHGSVAVVTSPAQYGEVLKALADGGFTLEQRRRLAAAGLRPHRRLRRGRRPPGSPPATPRTRSRGDRLARPIAQVPGPGPRRCATARTRTRRRPSTRRGSTAGRPERVGLRGDLPPDAGIASAEVLHGKAMSYNNYVDADAARRAAYDFAEPCVAIIKHSNPCGIAVGTQHRRRAREGARLRPAVSLRRGDRGQQHGHRRDGPADHRGVHRGGDRPGLRPGGAGDPVRAVEEHPAAALRPARRGPAGGDGASYAPVRDQLTLNSGRSAAECSRRPRTVVRRSLGMTRRTGSCKAGEAADAATLADLAFAWRACRAVKSNAILLAAGGASVGVGMGQVNRVDSSRLAVARAGNRAAGSVAASDAYFPFPDGFEILAEAGVRAVAEPGGSIRDDARDRGRAGGGRHAVLHRRPALLPLRGDERDLGDGIDSGRQGDCGQGQGGPEGAGRRACRSGASCPGSARSWSATTRGRTRTWRASTGTARRWASPRSAGTCPPRRRRRRSRRPSRS